MGFFRASVDQRISNQEDSKVVTSEHYVKKVTRIPSMKEPYVNEEFVKTFSEKSSRDTDGHCSSSSSSSSSDDIISIQPKKTARFRFSSLFRRRNKQTFSNSTGTNLNSNKENITPTWKDVGDETPIHNGSNSSLLNSLGFKTAKRSLRDRIKRSKSKPIPDSQKDGARNKNSNEVTQQNVSFRARLFGTKASHKNTKRLDDTETPLASPIYDAHETLTQRYMGNNYATLLDDLDAIPFDLTIPKEQVTFPKIISNAFMSLSPTKSHLSEKHDNISISSSFKSKAQAEYIKSLNCWNPYDIAKKLNKLDSISITSSEYDLAERNKVKVGKHRVSRVSTLMRSLSKITNRKKEADVAVKPSKVLEEGGCGTPVSFETNFKPFEYSSDGESVRSESSSIVSYKPNSESSNTLNPAQDFLDKKIDQFFEPVSLQASLSGSTKKDSGDDPFREDDSSYQELGLESSESKIFTQNVTVNTIAIAPDNASIYTSLKAQHKENDSYHRELNKAYKLSTVKRSHTYRTLQPRKSSIKRRKTCVTRLSSWKSSKIPVTHLDQDLQTKPDACDHLEQVDEFPRPITSSDGCEGIEKDELDDIYEQIKQQRKYHKERINGLYKELQN